MQATIYVCGDKLSNYETGEALGLTGEALKNFSYAAYEVELTLEVDDKGNATITHVDGDPLAKHI